MSVRFHAQEQLEAFLEEKHACVDDLRVIRDTLECLYNEYTSKVTPVDNNPTFIVATGAPGAGKTTFLKKICDELYNNCVLLDHDTIRSKLPLFNDAIEKKLSDGIPQYQVDDLARKECKIAVSYLYSRLLNRFSEENYNIATSIMPKSFLGNAIKMIQKAHDAGHCCKILMFNAPYRALQRSIFNRSHENGHFAVIGKQSMQNHLLPTLSRSLLDEPFPCSFYWRGGATNDAVLALSKESQGEITIVDNQAYIDFIDNIFHEQQAEEFDALVNSRLALHGASDATFGPNLS